MINSIPNLYYNPVSYRQNAPVAPAQNNKPVNAATTASQPDNKPLVHTSWFYTNDLHGKMTKMERIYGMSQTFDRTSLSKSGTSLTIRPMIKFQNLKLPRAIYL